MKNKIFAIIMSLAIPEQTEPPPKIILLDKVTLISQVDKMGLFVVQWRNHEYLVSSYGFIEVK